MLNMILPKPKKADKRYHIHAIFGELGSGKSHRLAYEMTRLVKQLNTEALVFSPQNRLPDRFVDGTRPPIITFNTGMGLIGRHRWKNNILVYTGDDFEHFLDIVREESSRRLKSPKRYWEKPKPLVLGIDEASYSEGLSSGGAQSRQAKRFRAFFDSLRHENIIAGWCSPHPSAATHHILGLVTAVSFYKMGSNIYMRHFRNVKSYKLPLSPLRLNQYESVELYSGESALWAHYPFNPLNRTDCTRRWNRDKFNRGDIEVEYLEDKC